MMTILRKAEYRALRGMSLSGRVLDLGGTRSSEYHRLFTGEFSITTANLSPEADIVCDFEHPLPIESESYDAVLLINVLEHIFEYRQLLNEATRVLRPDGTIIIIVPFLFPYHASPDDFHRYTASALERALIAAQCKDVRVEALGSGVCAARWLFLERLLPGPLRFVSMFITPLATGIDWLIVAVVRALRKSYVPSDYALGFIATAKKV